MLAEHVVRELTDSRRFFEKSTSVFEEKDSTFAPPEGERLYTVAQHVAHVAHTAEWFLEGAFGKGFSMDFAAHDAEVRKFNSLGAAREYFARAYDQLTEAARSKTDDELLALFPSDDPIMHGSPKLAFLSGLVDHTAHHRGTLTVYARLLGKQSPMPYM